MWSFLSQSSGGASPNENKRGNSEKMRMISNMKISYTDQIVRGRESSHHGSSQRNLYCDNFEMASNVYSFNGKSNLLKLKHNGTNPRLLPKVGGGMIQVKNCKKNKSELQPLKAAAYQ